MTIRKVKYFSVSFKFYFRTRHAGAHRCASKVGTPRSRVKGFLLVCRDTAEEWKTPDCRNNRGHVDADLVEGPKGKSGHVDSDLVEGPKGERELCSISLFR